MLSLSRSRNLGMLLLAYLCAGPGAAAGQECVSEQVWHLEHNRVLQVGRNDTFPQFLEIETSETHGSLFGCNVDISIKSPNGQVVWDDGHAYPDAGQVFEHSRAGIAYTIEIVECPMFMGHLKVRTVVDYSGSNACSESRQATKDASVEGLRIRLLSDEFIVLVSNKVYHLKEHEEKSVSSEASIAHGLGYSSGAGYSASAGLSLGPLSAEVQREISRSHNISISSQVSTGVSVNLRSEICKRWLVTKTEKRVMIGVTAPTHGFDTETAMTLVTDVDVSSEPLCDPT